MIGKLSGLSFSRFLAVMIKEFIQMRRDRVTFGTMIGVPVMQLLLFGYAINTDPRHLATLVEMRDTSPTSRAILMSMQASEYFELTGTVDSAEEAATALREGRATVVLTIPNGFERDLIRGLQPELLLTADASDPTATAAATSAISRVVDTALSETRAALGTPSLPAPPINVVTHRAFNPEGRSATNIVPGLLAIILAMTLVMMTSVAIVREREKGTMETLLSTPVRPMEVMCGKIIPYVLVGYFQTAIFLITARVLFDVPFTGSPAAFFLGFNLYLVANLALGFLISTVTRIQMQAMQVSFFLLLPTILLSGFMFPFSGMPLWAQTIGNVLPATHFLRLTRKVMLKSATLPDVMPDIAGIVVIMIVVVTVALMRYRQTLD